MKIMHDLLMRIGYLVYLIRSFLGREVSLSFWEWIHDEGLDLDLVDHSWLCVCGHYEESDFHCEICGKEPPWGCDCSFCDERNHEARLNELEWLAVWEDYPGELLAENADFEG